MQENSWKCHLILSTNEPAKIQIGEPTVKHYLAYKLFLKFHLTNISKQFVKKQVIN